MFEKCPKRDQNRAIYPTWTTANVKKKQARPRWREIFVPQKEIGKTSQESLAKLRRAQTAIKEESVCSGKLIGKVFHLLEKAIAVVTAGLWHFCGPFGTGRVVFFGWLKLIFVVRLGGFVVYTCLCFLEHFFLILKVKQISSFKIICKCKEYL